MKNLAPARRCCTLILSFINGKGERAGGTNVQRNNPAASGHNFPVFTTKFPDDLQRKHCPPLTLEGIFLFVANLNGADSFFPIFSLTRHGKPEVRVPRRLRRDLCCSLSLTHYSLLSPRPDAFLRSSNTSSGKAVLARRIAKKQRTGLSTSPTVA